MYVNQLQGFLGDRRSAARKNICKHDIIFNEHELLMIYRLSGIVIIDCRFIYSENVLMKFKMFYIFERKEKC